MSYKQFYSRFLEQHQGELWLTAHSHQFWPDVTFDAQMQYWLDSSKFVDDKWNEIFSKKIPTVQKQISHLLGLTNSEQIVFAPNTHELVYRLLSCLFDRSEVKILTTDSEFYSFDRQLYRLAEDQKWQITIVKTEPLNTFEQRFNEELKKQTFDFVFLSQVFFNSSYIVSNISSMIDKIDSDKTIFVVDGYHGFMSVPTNLKQLEDQIFYIAGSYKYAQGGEGCCFMTVPKNCQLRPQNTGWFADFANLSNYKNKIEYSNSAMRFAGSTMDYTTLYRLSSVLDLYEKQNIPVELVFEHVKKVQTKFIETYEPLLVTQFNCRPLFNRANLNQFASFLTYEFETEKDLKTAQSWLESKKIKTDSRGLRLRFGFALYHDVEDLKNNV